MQNGFLHALLWQHHQLTLLPVDKNFFYRSAGRFHSKIFSQQFSELFVDSQGNLGQLVSYAHMYLGKNKSYLLRPVISSPVSLYIHPYLVPFLIIVLMGKEAFLKYWQIYSLSNVCFFALGHRHIPPSSKRKSMKSLHFMATEHLSTMSCAFISYPKY